MHLELRCPGTMHAKLVDGGIEVKCRRRSCGYRRGVVVLHVFDLHTGQLVDTKKYAEPREVSHGKRSAVRSARPQAVRG